MIRFPKVLVIDPDGNQLGTMSSRDAQLKANELGLDLYCVAPNAETPVCKILDYSKYRYEQKRKERESRKNQKTVEIKEIQLTPQISMHDLETKAKAANKFLLEGNRVRARVMFRGRQLTHIEVGEETLNKFLELCSENGELDKPPLLDGKWLNATIIPKKRK
ncbi:MAG: translation initiation factor IF-3 [Coprobacillus sp.]|nr:translation initiation factor IF-3 [Coprobacillus sp.]